MSEESSESSEESSGEEDSSSEKGEESSSYIDNDNEHSESTSSDYSSDYLHMAVYAERGEEITDSDISELEQILEDAIESGEIKESEITKNPYKVKESLEYLQEILDEYYSDKGKYESLRSFLLGKGYVLKNPSKIGTYDDTPEAVARTNTEDSIEGNIDLYAKIIELGRYYGLSIDETEELVVAHELVHLAQPERVKKGQPTPYIAEMDAELKLTEYFAHKAEQAKGKEMEKYARMASVTYTRFLGLYSALASQGQKKSMNFIDYKRNNSLDNICRDYHKAA